MRKKDESILHPMVFPHDLAHALFTSCPSQFMESFVGKPGAVANWWSKQWDATWVQQHPALSGCARPSEADHVIPFWIHGDEIHYAVRGKSMVLSYGSRVGVAKSPWASRFIICILPCDITIKNVTLSQVLYYFSKSCQILLN